MSRISSLAGKRIGFATMDALPELTQADQMAADVLRAENALVDAVVWTNDSTTWNGFDAIVVRSTWDYHLNTGRFLRWLDALEQSGSRIFNPLPVLRWNLDKHYLLDLKARKIRIPQTLFLEMEESLDPEQIRIAFSHGEVVVKPAISASAWETRRISLANLSTPELDWISALHSEKSIIFQEYMPEVVIEGEWSFLYFGPVFSHAVVKRPATGDFRVQEEWGGNYSLETPPRRLMEQATEIARTLNDSLLYARIDAIVRQDELYLMELELVEPALYFDVHPASAKAFCERLADIFR